MAHELPLSRMPIERIKMRSAYCGIGFIGQMGGIPVLKDGFALESMESAIFRNAAVSATNEQQHRPGRVSDAVRIQAAVPV
jgi:hypothetical protein